MNENEGSYVLHYEEIDGSGEYIVITDCGKGKENIADNCINGYKFSAAYPIDDTGTLPTERALSAK